MSYAVSAHMTRKFNKIKGSGAHSMHNKLI